MKLFLAACIFSMLLVVDALPQAKTVKNVSLAKAVVVSIQKSAFAADVEPSQDSYLVVVYKILKLYRGKMKTGEIKIAHFGDTHKNLKVGSEVCFEVEKTDRFHQTAKTALEDFGVVIPDESLADYVFVRDVKSCEN